MTLPRIDEKDANVLVLEFRERLLCVPEVFTRNLVVSLYQAGLIQGDHPFSLKTNLHKVFWSA